jgi:hypothetical protein
MENVPSRKVAQIREFYRKAREEPDSSEAKRAHEEAAQQQKVRESKLRGATTELLDLVDHALDTAVDPNPASLVPVILEQLPRSKRDDALHAALRVYVEVRIYERQGEPGLVRTEPDEKVRENRLRRMAARQGLALQKSPRRDPHALGYGTYRLIDAATKAVVAMDRNLHSGYGLDLDDVERRLRRGKDA